MTDDAPLLNARLPRVLAVAVLTLVFAVAGGGLLWSAGGLMRARELKRISGLPLRSLSFATFVRRGSEERPGGRWYELRVYDLRENSNAVGAAGCPAGYEVEKSARLETQVKAFTRLLRFSEEACVKRVEDGDLRHVLVLVTRPASSLGRLLHYKEPIAR